MRSASRPCAFRGVGKTAPQRRCPKISKKPAGSPCARKRTNLRARPTAPACIYRNARVCALVCAVLLPRACGCNTTTARAPNPLAIKASFELGLCNTKAAGSRSNGIGGKPYEHTQSGLHQNHGNRSSNPRSCCCSKGDGGCQQAAHPSEAADKRVKTHAYRAPLETESTGHKITAFNHYHGGNACNGVFPPMRMPSVPPVPTRRAHLGARPPAGGHTTIAAPVFQRLLSLGANSRRMWKNSWMISTYRLMQAGM